MNDLKLKRSDADKLVEWCYEVLDEGGTHFHGMNFEQGIMAVLDVMEGNSTVEEAIGQ